jgi:hypothetical protein
MFNKARTRVYIYKIRQEENKITVYDTIEVLERPRYNWR